MHRVRYIPNLAARTRSRRCAQQGPNQRRHVMPRSVLNHNMIGSDDRFRASSTSHENKAKHMLCTQTYSSAVLKFLPEADGTQLRASLVAATLLLCHGFTSLTRSIALLISLYSSLGVMDNKRELTTIQLYRDEGM